MPVQSAEAVLKQAVQDRLDEVVPEDLWVTFHLSTATDVSSTTVEISGRADGEDGDEEAEPEKRTGFVINSSLVWFLNLWITDGGRDSGVNIHASIPFTCGHTGSTEQILTVLDGLWDQFVLHRDFSQIVSGQDPEQKE